MTLAALNVELGRLVEIDGQVGKGLEIEFRARTKFVWKEDLMKQLLEQTRSQTTSLQFLMTLSEGDLDFERLHSKLTKPC